MKSTLSVLVNNHPGVLSKVVGLFSRRSFNIDSLAVGITENPEISRITIVVDGEEPIVYQVLKQLEKLIDVIKVKKLDSSNSVSRELALVKIDSTPEKMSGIIQLVEVFRVKVVDISKTSITIEASGSGDKLNALLEVLEQYGITETVRTGVIALERGNENIHK